MTAAPDLRYTAEDFTAELSAADYIRRYRDPQRFGACCRRCPNYGRSWGCPPFGFDPAERMGRYSRLLLVATQIRPADPDQPIDLSQQLIRPERLRLERQLRQLEARFGGLMCAYIGSCLHCPAGTCTRPQGLPCRHPEAVRPSLEAFGFDIGRTLSDLFGFELRWGRDGRLPDYLTLVCALFHNEAGPIRFGGSGTSIIL